MSRGGQENPYNLVNFLKFSTFIMIYASHLQLLVSRSMTPTHNTKVKYHDGKDKETENNTQLYQNINFLNLFVYQQGPSWPWSYGSWIYIYICNHLPITTDVVGLTPAQGEDPVQHYVIQFVSDLRQVGGVLRVLLFPLPINWPPRYS